MRLCSYFVSQKRVRGFALGTNLGPPALILLLSAVWGCVPVLRAQRSPDFDQRFRQAVEAMRNGDMESAAAGFTVLTKEAPTFAAGHFNLGLVREDQGRHEDAIASLQKAILLNPKLRGANLFLGIAEYRLNRLDEAARALRKETASFPKDAIAWMWLGVVELSQQLPEEAANALDKAAKLAPDNIDILYHRGQAHLLVSKDSYTRMFKADPRSWRVHQVLAQTAYEAERYDEAIVEYLAAVKLAPNQPGLHEELGSAYRGAGKMEEADEAFRRELVIDPYNILAKYKLGVLQVEKGNAADGKKLIEDALKEKPELLNSDYNLGRAEMLLGDDQAALKDLERAISGNSDLETVQQAWYQLGIVYRKLHRMGDAQKAMAMFQKLKDDAAQNLQRAMRKYSGQQGMQVGEPPAPAKPN